MKTITCEEINDDIVNHDVNMTFRKKPKKEKGLIDSSYFQNNSRVYINTNDQTRSVTEDVPQGSHILTVAGSGDYLLDSIMHEAKSITAFDINRFQYYIVCLKLWAIQVLDYKEYVSFFTDITSPNFLSSSLINKIINNFKDEPAYEYLKSLAICRSIEEEIANDNLKKGISFHEIAILINQIQEFLMKNPNAYGDIDSLYRNNLVLRASLYGSKQFKVGRILQYPLARPHFIGHMASKENFEATKMHIKSSDLFFMICDLLSLKNLDKKFNRIFLSNIPYYLDENKAFKIITSLVSVLKKDGVLSYYHHEFKAEWLEDLDFFPYEIENPQDISGIVKAINLYNLLISNGYHITPLQLEQTSYLFPGTSINSDVKFLVKKKQ